MICVECLGDLVSKACAKGPTFKHDGPTAPNSFDLRHDWRYYDTVECADCKRVMNGSPHFVEESALDEFIRDLMQEGFSYSDAREVVHDIAWSAANKT